MTAIATIAGLLLIAVALRDIFDTLFHPHGRGVISRLLVAVVWRVARIWARGRHEVLSVAGPTAFLTIVLSWVALVVIGSALIIAPHLPDGFVFDPGLDPAANDGFVDAVYFSYVSLTSLGYGDIAAEGDLLRLLGPFEAMIGLGILTASISWVLSIYRVLTNSRAAAREIGLLHDAERRTGISLSDLDPASVAEILDGLTSRLVIVRRDHLNFPIAYYFHARDQRHELSQSLPWLIEIIDQCAEGPPGLRIQAARLEEAVDELLDTIDDEFLGGERPGRDEVLGRWRRDHLRPGPTSPAEI